MTALFDMFGLGRKLILETFQLLINDAFLMIFFTGVKIALCAQQRENFRTIVSLIFENFTKS